MIFFGVRPRRPKAVKPVHPTSTQFWMHLNTHHEESDDDIFSLLQEAHDDHPSWTVLQLLDLIHNRQHTSLDWDAGHPEEEV